MHHKHSSSKNSSLRKAGPATRRHLLRSKWGISLASLGLCVLLGTSLKAQTAAPETFQHQMTYQGKTVTINFTRFNTRGPNFGVYTVGANPAVLTPYTAKPHRTYLGTVVGEPGSQAAAMIKNDGKIYARVEFENGYSWQQYDTTVLERGSEPVYHYPRATVTATGAGSNVMAADVAFDSPTAYYTGMGSNVDEVVNILEYNNICTSLMYHRQMGITHRMSRVVVRQDPAGDPYIGLNLLQTLQRMEPEWMNVLPASVVPASSYDLAAVVKYNDGGGYARSLAVIGDRPFSSNGISGFGDFTNLWRHEAGHLWGSDHEVGGAPEGQTIMSNGNLLSRVSGTEQYTILQERTKKAAILDNLGAFSYPVPPSANTDAVRYPLGATTVTVDVLLNDHDANGDALSLLSFDTKTKEGGNVTRSVGTGPNGRDQLIITPSGSAVLAGDYLNYRIQDATGRTATGVLFLKPIVPQSEIYHQWTFDEGERWQAEDCGCCGVHLNKNNKPVYSNDAVRGKSIQLDGLGAHLEGNAEDNFTSNSVTMTAWIKRNGDQIDYSGIVGKYTNGAACLNVGVNNELRYHWPSTSNWAWNSGLILPDNVWTFAALVVTPTNATIYMDSGNGMQSATYTSNHSAVSFVGKTRIGFQEGWSRYFKGLIDEASIFNGALSVADLTKLKNGQLIATTPNPAVGEHVWERDGYQLSWQFNATGATQQLYFGTDFTAVRNATTSTSGIYKGAVTGNSFALGQLSEGDYFWRLDTVVSGQTRKGVVWTFRVEAPVGEWKLDDSRGNQLTDTSGNGAHFIKGSGHKVVASDISGNMAILDGTNPLISQTNINAPNGCLTMAGWVKRNGTQASSAGIIFLKNEAAKRCGLNTSSSGSLFFHWDDGGWWIPTNLTLPDNQWCYVALVVKSPKAYIYLHDGVDWKIFESNEGVGSIGLKGKVYLGQDTAEAGNAARMFKGSLDNWMVYPEAMGKDRLEKMRLQSLEPEMVTPVAHWSFDESSGSQIADSSGNGNHGVISGNPALNVAGKIGGGIQLDGVDDRVVCNLPDLQWSTFTVSVWARSNSSTQNSFSSVFSSREPAASNTFQIDLTGGNYSYRGSQVVTIGAAPVGEWVHLTVACDGLQTRLYHNGILVNSIAGVVDGYLDNLIIGSNRLADQRFNGAVDQLKVYDRALTSQEVSNLFAEGAAQNAAPGFASSTLNLANAQVASAYTGQLTATDPDAGDVLNFSLVSGPAWLNVANNGTLSGTPSASDQGLNQWTVRVIDAGGLFADATLMIQVNPIPNAAPSFNSNPVVVSNAMQATAYTGSLVGMASDPNAGDVLSFSKISGPAWLSISSNGSLSGTPSLTDVGVNQWSIRVSDAAGLTATATLQITVSALPQSVTYTAIGENITAGTITSGNYSSTLTSNNVYEVLRERRTGTKTSNYVSSLEHRWTFNLANTGSSVEFSVEAHHTANSEGDDFVFAYSTNGINYTNLVTVTKTADNNTPQKVVLPTNVSGTVYIRVMDLNRTQGRGVQDSLSIDAMSLTVLP